MEVANLTATIDPEIISFIEALVNPESLTEVLRELEGMDPDTLLDLYLSGQLDSWVLARKKVNNITPDPLPDPEVKSKQATIKDVRRYINRRWDRWHDYSKYHCQLNKLFDQSGDLLNEVLIMVLLKDESLLIKLYSQKKQGYTGLDYYILNLIKMNSHSLTSPYRHKHRTLLKDANASGVLMSDDTEDETELSIQFLHTDQEEDREEENEPEDTEYQEEDPSELIVTRFRIIRDILDQATELTEKEKEVFRYRFFLNNPWNKWPGKDGVKNLRTSFRKAQDYIIDKVSKQREIHNRKVIHELFQKTKSISIRINESEFLLMREYLSRQKELNEDLIAVAKEDLSEESRIAELFKQGAIVGNFEKKLLMQLEDELKTNEINHKF